MIQNVPENSSQGVDDDKPQNNVKQPKDQDYHCQNLLELPLELQAKIFSGYLRPIDLFKIRQVNSRFQVLIDDYIGFSIKIDDVNNSDMLDFVSEVAIRQVVINHMTEIKDPISGQLTPPVFDDLFSYPQYLQSILITGFIDPDFLSDMIRKCKVVDAFELNAGSCIVNKWKEFCVVSVLPEIDILCLDPTSQSFFPRCKSLKILLKDTITTSWRNVHTQAVLKIMKTVRSSCLERVVSQCWSSSRYSVSRISAIFAECLERNPSIRSYFVGILSGSHPDNYEDDSEDVATINQEEEEELREFTKAKLSKASRQMTVENLGISTTSADMVLWKEFIKYQNNIVHLSFTVDVEDGVFSNEMFRSCEKTLIQFVLRGRFLTTFDFHWIEDCHKLQEICLHNVTNEGEPIGPSIQTVNVSLIPAGVESLVLFQTTSRTDDLTSALRKLTKLNTLVLFKTGNTAGETGIDPDFLKQVLTLRTLESVLLVRFVADSADSAGELVKIMHSMKDPQQTVTAADPDDDDDPPPLVPIIEDQGAAGVEPELLEDKSNLKDPNEACDEQGPSACSQIRDQASDDIFADPPTSKTELRGDILEPQQPKENGIETTTNDLEGACALPVSNSVPVHKMEPNLLTDVPESKTESDLGEEGASYIPNKESEEVPQQTVIKDENNDSSPPPPPTISEILAVVEAEDWEDVEDDDDDEEDEYEGDSDDEDSLLEFNFHDAGFAVENNNDDVVLDVIGQAENGQDFQLVLNLDNEDDLENMLGLLEPVADNNNNIAFGFIIDGVIDILNPTSRWSRWIGVEDENGHLTYTLKITID